MEQQEQDLHIIEDAVVSEIASISSYPKGELYSPWIEDTDLTPYIIKFAKLQRAREAVQFFADKPETHLNVSYGWPKGESDLTPHELDNKFLISTLEGRHIVSEGDWIITGVKGEHYPCKPDIFEMTYEPVLD